MPTYSCCCAPGELFGAGPTERTPGGWRFIRAGPTGVVVVVGGHAPFCPPFFPWFGFETRVARITLLDQLAPGTPERDWRVPGLGGDGIGWPARCEAPPGPLGPLPTSGSGHKPHQANSAFHHCAARGSERQPVSVSSRPSQIPDPLLADFISPQNNTSSLAVHARPCCAPVSSTWLPLLPLAEPACDGSTRRAPPHQNAQKGGTTLTFKVWPHVL